MQRALDHRSLYRLPWSLSDNPIAWLEPTQHCNLACDGCYRENLNAHKSMAEVERDLAVFDRLRNFDGVSIAGGDPLTHPRVVEIVAEVTRRGRKAIVNTNGLAMTREMLVELKRAGLVGVTFHVDSRQGRPGWKNKTEVEMNELRDQYAEMVAGVGGIACAFNSTVYEDTLSEVPELVAWAERRMDRVHTMVFIAYRAAVVDGFDYYAAGKKVDMGQVVYSIDAPRRTDITSREITREIRKRFPDFEPCAYLNGTHEPDAFKWLLAMRTGKPGRTHGWMGPRFMEATQTAHHLVTGRYLSYAPLWSLETGRGVLSSMWTFDPGARRAAKRWLASVARNPLEIAHKLHMQAIVMIQPIDILPDGRDSMCDGCPDMTVHEGKLVWSCRLEEPRKFGEFVTAVPKPRGEARPALPVHQPAHPRS